MLNDPSRHLPGPTGVSLSSQAFGRDPMKYRLGDLTIDTGRQLVSRGAIPIPLPKLSYDLLLVLVRAAPDVVTLDELMRRVWPGIIVSPETVSQRVKLVRDALEDDPREPRYIAGLRGRGYQIVAETEALSAAQLPQEATARAPEFAQGIANGSIGAAGLDSTRPDLAPARIAICVLPFTNMSGDPAQEYFSDGITEDIITELSRWRLLAVRSRSASFRYRGPGVDTKQVARELNVRFIVEGSVRRMESRIRISAQLIDTETGSHIWAEKFDREDGNLFTVQDQVVRTIVSTLVGRAQVSDIERAGRKPSASLVAYECVLKGNALPWDDPEGAAEANRLFEKAVKIDPAYGHAHALLAAMRWREWQNDPGSSNALLDEGIALATRAVSLDENESSCLSLLAQGLLLRGSFDLALQHIRRAVEMNPSNQWNAADMGFILVYAGEAGEALAWFKHAKEIDPYFDEPWYWRSMGLAHMILQRYDEALAAFDHHVTPQYRVAAYRAACYARLGDNARAKASAEQCLVLKPDFSVHHFITRQSFKNPATAATLAESMRLAGLPDRCSA